MDEVMEIWMEMEKRPKLDPEDNISHLIPREYGIYAWFNKRTGCVEYIGRSTREKGGLYKRIIKEHLNPTYLLTNRKKWCSKDEFQKNNYIIHNGKPAIDKSAFRKNISRFNKLTPGIESVNFIKKNFFLRFLIINDKNEAKKLEKQLRDKFRKELIII